MSERRCYCAQGCPVSHAALLSFARAKNSVHRVTSASRVFLASAHTFDVSLGDVVATLTAGACLCSATRGTVLHRLGWCLQARASFNPPPPPPLLQTVPLPPTHTTQPLPVLCGIPWMHRLTTEPRHLRDRLPAVTFPICSLQLTSSTHVTTTPSCWALLGAAPLELPALRVVALGGEPTPPALAARWAGHVELLNTYGVTECTVYQTAGARVCGAAAC